MTELLYVREDVVLRLKRGMRSHHAIGHIGVPYMYMYWYFSMADMRWGNASGIVCTMRSSQPFDWVRPCECDVENSRSKFVVCSSLVAVFPCPHSY